MSLGDLFYIHKSDRIALIFIGIVIVIFVFVFYIPNNIDNVFFAPLSPSDSTRTARTGHNAGIERGNGGYYYVEGKEAKLAPFDPNTADSTQLLSLGLQPWMVRNIYRYRAAGGVYRRPSDFARLYGLTKKQYEILLPYIRISDEYRAAADFYAETANYDDALASRNLQNNPPRDTLKYPHKLRPGETIALNASDTTELKKVPGIGSAYALAIVRRRERLGGFYSAQQLLEIDGLPAQALPYFAVDGSVNKININKSTYSQLRQHPYFNYYQARDIVDYRRLHGNIKSLQQLRLLKSFTAADLERLSHYVEY